MTNRRLNPMMKIALAPVVRNQFLPASCVKMNLSPEFGVGQMRGQAPRPKRVSGIRQIMLWTAALMGLGMGASHISDTVKMADTRFQVPRLSVNAKQSPSALLQNMTETHSVVATHTGIVPNRHFEDWFRLISQDASFQNDAEVFFNRQVNAAGEWTGPTTARALYKGFLQDVVVNHTGIDLRAKWDVEHALRNVDQVFERSEPGYTPHPPYLGMSSALLIGIMSFLEAFRNSRLKRSAQNAIGTIVQQSQAAVLSFQRRPCPG